ncbi:hypothetical protein [Clostridium cellulovorans]|uniref:Uncharacterized protein n=1 Tax=Clostridium cellulovorans (strain ATCC 35296 / DSM 3052 / OCM 3 / 743B) TaxID=573061 RepID=D9SPT6_CLOC7|nr:hypothetical protein [Clostridium cellulovorans]ADL52072.1 hypothetical protein Clocel_2356 [Clostridium cellulovorans 743B]
MSTVTVILPKDMTELEEKYAEVMASIVAEKLTTEQLGFLIKVLENGQTA